MTRFENDVADAHPLATELAKGTYFWCNCGRTANVPFCDGKHGRSGITPMEFRVEEPKTYNICNCGLTCNPPYCDGSHSEIE